MNFYKNKCDIGLILVQFMITLPTTTNRLGANNTNISRRDDYDEFCH